MRAIFSISVLLAACHPSLPEAGGRDAAGGGAGEPGAITLELEPPAPLTAASPALRFRVMVPSVSVAADAFVVATGELGPGHLRQLADGDLSNALTERLLPVRSWVEELDDGGTLAHVAPALLLEPGEQYTVAAGEPKLAFVVEVAEDGALPLLSRRWPPPGMSATAEHAVWCGGQPLAEETLRIALDPGGAAGVLRTGVSDGVGSMCLRFDADTSPTGEPAQAVPFDDAPVATGWLAPPLVDVGGVGVLLEPSPLAAEATPPGDLPSPRCDGEHPLPFGPGCAALLDDRLLVRAPEARLLWAIHGEGIDAVVDVAAGGPMVVAPLSPGSAVSLDVVTVDVAGRSRRDPFRGVTAGPMPHVVLNEVLANPLGVEPSQEWVEIVNSGPAPALLHGYTLEDVGGVTPLPRATLLPGAFAIVVGEGFVEDDMLDPPLPAGVLVLPVAKVGKNGLSNSGEPLTLRDGDGVVVSRFPPAPKPKAGSSVARLDPLAPDEVPTSFTHSVPTPGEPNSAGAASN